MICSCYVIIIIDSLFILSLVGFWNDPFFMAKYCIGGVSFGGVRRLLSIFTHTLL